jgi:hypothetical protein
MLERTEQRRRQTAAECLALVRLTADPSTCSALIMMAEALTFLAGDRAPQEPAGPELRSTADVLI